MAYLGVASEADVLGIDLGEDWWCLYDHVSVKLEEKGVMRICVGCANVRTHDRKREVYVNLKGSDPVPRQRVQRVLAVRHHVEIYRSDCQRLLFCCQARSRVHCITCP